MSLGVPCGTGRAAYLTLIGRVEVVTTTRGGDLGQRAGDPTGADELPQGVESPLRGVHVDNDETGNAKRSPQPSESGREDFPSAARRLDGGRCRSAPRSSSSARRPFGGSSGFACLRPTCWIFQPTPPFEGIHAYKCLLLVLQQAPYPSSNQLDHKEQRNHPGFNHGNLTPQGHARQAKTRRERVSVAASEGLPRISSEGGLRIVGMLRVVSLWMMLSHNWDQGKASFRAWDDAETSRSPPPSPPADPVP